MGRTAQDADRKRRTRNRNRRRRTFPAGSYIVRMDQPYSRIADCAARLSVLESQRSAADAVRRHRLDVPRAVQRAGGSRDRREGARRRRSKRSPATFGRNRRGRRTPASVSSVNHNADIALATLRYKFKDASFEAAEEPFEAGGKKFNRGSFIITNVNAADIQKAATDLGLADHGGRRRRHRSRRIRLRAPRVAIMHTWSDDANRRLVAAGVRHRADSVHLHQHAAVAKDNNLNATFDVIIFPPVGRGTQAIVNGMPMYGNPLPWKKTPETPNLGSEDETDDMRPGLGWTGVVAPAGLRARKAACS